MFIYVASPYSSPESGVRNVRYTEVMRVRAWLGVGGPRLVAYSPILHAHPMCIEHDIYDDAAFWRRKNHAMMCRSAGLYILQLDGWEHSTGVKMEKEFADDLQLPITMCYWNELLEEYLLLPERL